MLEDCATYSYALSYLEKLEHERARTTASARRWMTRATEATARLDGAMIAASMLRQQVAAWKEKWEKANKSLRSARRALADREREAVSLRDHIQRLDDEVQERYRAFRKCVPVDVTNHYDKHTTVRHYHLRFRFPDLRFSAPEELLRQDAHPHTVRRRIKTELVAAFSEDIDRQLLHMIVEESRG